MHIRVSLAFLIILVVFIEASNHDKCLKQSLVPFKPRLRFFHCRDRKQMRYKKHTTIFLLCDQLVKLLIAFFLLMISNDIHPNPGPENCLTFSNFTEIHKLNPDKAKYIHVNFQSMKSKPEAFMDIMDTLEDKNTVFGFSETWLTKDDPAEQWTYDREVLCAYRKDRTVLSKKNKGGGVLMLVPKDRNPKIRSDLSFNTPNIDDIWVEADSPKGSLYGRQILCLLYSPNKRLKTELLDHLLESLDKCSMEQKEILIMGDLNINLLDTNDSNELKEVVAQYGLDFTNESTPTRLTGTSKSLIDHHISSDAHNYFNAVAEFPFSDHNITSIINSTESKVFSKEEHITYRDRKQYNPHVLRERLECKNWEEIEQAYYSGRANQAIDYQL